ncbi:LysR family transcriptional regulator [Ideonella livida]|uniref:LysR family transcriptional regulator n=1 Tax=Ideonella livida TaxID=2707176 RepID=A0A7C9PFB3_9BURK|nr:LysR family transcriptional regulator [Ideonella livida]NDY90395.1 LysR family transcriptional regulator [Ideonella livida]
MTLVQLRHFIALAETASFVQAADQVCLSQPALSRSIRALEDELGRPLFDRLGRRAELTPFGHQALVRARQLVDDAQELHSLAAPGMAGRLRLGLGSGPGALLMTPLLLDLARDPAAMATLEISRGPTERLVDALRERSLDALVVDARSLTPAPDLRSAFVHELRGAFMVRPGHPLLAAARQGPLPFSALQDYPVASTPLSEEIARMLVEHYGPQAHPERLVRLRCEEIPSLVAVASASNAVLLAVRATAPALMELPLDPPMTATARFGLVTLARRTEHPALDWLRQRLQECLVEMPPGGAPGSAPVS